MGYTYWCAACGNPDIIVENTKSGYSMGKGIAGAAVLGPVGAVAGLDGKKTVTYYCPKCGAKLNHCMPDYEVESILRLLKDPELFRNLLETKHKKYPNMMMPSNWVEKTTTTQKGSGELDFDQFLRILQTSNEINCGDRLYDYIHQYGVITDDQVNSLEDELKRRKLDNEIELFRHGFHEIINGYGNNYKVKIEFVENSAKDGYANYIAARDKNEIREWRLEQKAHKKATREMSHDKYVEFVKGLLANGPVTIDDVEQAVISIDPDINNDNPYLLHEVAKVVCVLIERSDARVEFDDHTLRIKSTKHTEEEMRWSIEENWRSGVIGDKTQRIKRVTSVLLSRGMAKATELADDRSVTVQGAAATASNLVNDGMCEKIRTNGTVYFSLLPEYKNWTPEDFEIWVKKENIGKDNVLEAHEKLKRSSGHSFFNIMGNKLDSSYAAKKYYECFMILELEGFARRTERPDEYIWEYVDKNAEAIDKLEMEKEQQEKELEICRNTYSQQITEWKELIEEVKGRLFDDSVYKKRLTELEQQKFVLSEKLSSLGFFKFSEKKQVNKEIDDCSQAIEKARGELEKAKQEFETKNANLVSKYEKEIRNANRTINDKIYNLDNIKINLNKLKGL